MNSKYQLYSSPQVYKRNYRQNTDYIGHTHSTIMNRFTPNPEIQNRQYLRQKRREELSLINQYKNPFTLFDDYHSVDQMRNERIKTTENYVKLPLIKSNKKIKARMSPYEKLNSRSIYHQPIVVQANRGKGKKGKKNDYKRICSVNCLQHSKSKQKSAKDISIPQIRKYLIQEKKAKYPDTQLNKYLSKVKAKQQAKYEDDTYRYFYQTFFGLQPEFYKLQTEYSKKLNENQRAPFIVSKKITEQIPAIPHKDDLAQFLRTYIPQNPDINMQKLLRSQKFLIQYSKNQLYFGQMVGNRKEGIGILLQNNKIFQGFFRNNYRVKGVQINNSGIYKGQFFNEKRDGNGQFSWLNGEYYIGQWSQGNRHGKGVWTNRYGDSYNGQWVMGKGQGYGVYIVDGEEYRGNFIDFKKDGYGRQKFIIGDIYEGEFSQGFPSGKGKYTWSNGTKYEGQFVNGLRSGKGILKTLDGFCYIGQFFDQRPQGLCQIFMPNGDKYHGYLREGKKNGRGTLYLKDLDKVFDGYWQDDYFIKNYAV